LGGLVLLLAAYAFFVEPTWIEVTEISVVLPGLHPNLDGFTILHISDLHLDSAPGVRNLERAISLANDIQPDLVVITGDFVSGRESRGIEDIARIARFATSRAVVAVLGNHDVAGGGGDRVAAALEAAGAVVLRNERFSLAEGSARLSILGLDDAGWAGKTWDGFVERWTAPMRLLDALLADVPNDEPRLLLVHNPDVLELLPSQRIDLALSGHTHGGQVYIPIVGSLWVPSHFGHRFARGRADVGGAPAVVSRGLGTITLPVRFFARPEIGIVRLTAGLP